MRRWTWLWLAVGLACTKDPPASTDDTDVAVDDTDVEDSARPDTDLVDLFDYDAVPQTIELPAGTYTIGSTMAEVGWSPLEAQRTVTLTHRVAIATHEIRQGQFEALMGYEPSLWSGCPQCPVERVSWNEAAAFAAALSIWEGLTACYTCAGQGGGTRCMVEVSVYQCDGYRLPTEAEWEAAGRNAGAVSGATPGGGSLTDADDRERCDADVPLTDGSTLGDQAWYCATADGTPGNTTFPVGQLQASPNGLYDMLGNVWEHTHDLYEDFPPAASTDPVGGGDDPYRTLKGGGWNSRPREVRLAFRTSTFPIVRSDNTGFRLARTLDPDPVPAE